MLYTSKNGAGKTSFVIESHYLMGVYQSIWWLKWDRLHDVYLPTSESQFPLLSQWTMSRSAPKEKFRFLWGGGGILLMTFSYILWLSQKSHALTLFLNLHLYSYIYWRSISYQMPAASVIVMTVHSWNDSVLCFVSYGSVTGGDFERDPFPLNDWSCV